MITEIKEAVHYDPSTGVFTWLKPDKKHSFLIGKEAGSNEGRYRRISVLGQRYLAHQLAFLYMLGCIPKEIDHFNRNGLDNRWSNLRETTHSDNLMNRSDFKRSTSGCRGVSWHKRHNQWRAMIKYKGVSYWLGYFDTKEEASEAYQAKRRELLCP